MKKIVVLFVLFVLVLSVGPPSVNACVMRDSSGRTVRSDCYWGAILKVRDGQFIYARVTPEGFYPGGWNVAHYEYYTTPDCQGPGHMVSYTKQYGLFFEYAQYRDETHFYFASMSLGTVPGDQIQSLYYGPDSTCYPYQNDERLFAPTELTFIRPFYTIPSAIIDKHHLTV